LSNLIPTLLMIAFFVFLFRQAKGAQDSVFSFGQARVKRFSKDSAEYPPESDVPEYVILFRI
ncbi:MAG: hypothetical protein QW279_09735, partial [Candidatus Jordarchaeaceae archaeon]